MKHKDESCDAIWDGQSLHIFFLGLYYGSFTVDQIYNMQESLNKLGYVKDRLAEIKPPTGTDLFPDKLMFSENFIQELTNKEIDEEVKRDWSLEAEEN
jgi:hypothetical protein